jgi:hypothetical protein
MFSCLVSRCKLFPSARFALVTVLTLLLSGWTTCTAIVGFGGLCPAAMPQPLITSLSPDILPSDAESVPLIVTGSGFVPQSQIMWNDTPLPTTFTDAHHLQTTITQQTLNSLAGSVGSSVQISVRSQGSAVILGCPNGGSSATFILLIN